MEDTSTDTTPEEVLDTSAVEEEASGVETEAEAPDYYDFSGWDGDVDALDPQYRNYGEFIRDERASYAAQIEDAKMRADHHRGLWEQMLQADDPAKYDELQKAIQEQKDETSRRQQIIDQLQKERDSWKDQYEDHSTKSNEQYLNWVENKYAERLKDDRDNNQGFVLESAEDLIVELGFDPDDALSLGFDHGLEAMASAADMVERGLPLESALQYARQLHPKASPAPEPEPEPEPAPAPAPAPAKHSRSASLVEDDRAFPRSPELTNAPRAKGRIFDPDAQDDIIRNATAGLFKMFRT